ncbi:YqgE/AlgH family protein [[Haemophilus] felis]|nr:YqgE/AlgH family protein [[Haemophilus] felis]
MQLQDHFLIAMPHMEDETFAQTVIYLCEHNESGSMGLVLNQPTDLSIAELCSKMNFMMKSNRSFGNDLVLAGGPVHTDRGFILHTSTDQVFKHSYKITDNITLTTSADIIDTLGSCDAPEKYLVALGCASWAPTQLEQEILNNDWLVVPANNHILFDVPYAERWLEANLLLGIQHHNFSGYAGHC